MLLAALAPWIAGDSGGVAPQAVLQAVLRPILGPVAVLPASTLPAPPPPARRHPLVVPGAPAAVATAMPAEVPSAPVRPAEPGGIPQARASAEMPTVALASNEVPGGPDAAGLRQFRLALAGEARHYRSYPEAARRAGLSGIAEVRVSVEAGGAARSAALNRSSGHAVLDAAALEMLSKAASRAPLPDTLRGQNFAVLLPVVFEVED